MGESGVRKQMGRWKKSNVKNLATLSLKRATCLRYTAVNKQLPILGSPDFGAPAVWLSPFSDILFTAKFFWALVLWFGF